MSEELSRARAREHQAAAEVDRLQNKVDDLQHLNDMERQVSTTNSAMVILQINMDLIPDYSLKIKS